MCGQQDVTSHKTHTKTKIQQYSIIKIHYYSSTLSILGANYLLKTFSQTPELLIVLLDFTLCLDLTTISSQAFKLTASGSKNIQLP